MATPLKIYQYAGCSTCKTALKFLKDQGVRFDSISIVDQPPTVAELKMALDAVDGNLKKLFNVSGQQYRELKMAEKIDLLSEKEALSLLSKNGKLMKRPLLIRVGGGAGTVRGGGDGPSRAQARVGFKAAEWAEFLG